MGKQIQLLFASISPKFFFEDYSNQDDLFVPIIPPKIYIFFYTRMMAQYYTKIRLGRMATLLALTEAETEDCLSDMVWVIIPIITFISMHH